jgi:hypothetical protein
MAMALAAIAPPAVADEGGVSFWIPGTFGSFSAVPQEAGWSISTIYYHTSVSDSGQVSASRQATRGRLTSNVSGTLTGDLAATSDLMLFAPSYTFGQPVLGSQLTLNVGGVYGNSSANASAVLTGTASAFAFQTSGSRGDAVTGFGDLSPEATMRWSVGNQNFMTYVTGNIPVGSYDPARLANLGIGHGALDGGAGYTYFDVKKGHEFTAVAGATYNFQNASTQYQNGVDLHLDWAASQFVSDQVHIGVAGYVYDQVTPDIGALPIQGSFESRVAGVGPQVGFFFPLGRMQGYVNLKGYWEFGAVNRPEGWNTWLTLSISPAPKT